jgi:predicted RNase H-like HicB family nuclease/predicted RNA binding protein YcfA (HicA-like mRNA interferase family)
MRNQELPPRELGSLAGEFHVPDDFDEPLPEALLAEFEGRETDDDAIDWPIKVQQVIRLIESEGWRQVAQRGSHRQFKHPTKPGRVTVAGKASDDCRFRRLGAGDVEQHIEAGWCLGREVMRYAVVIENAGGNYSAYVPDLPGCIATGPTVEAVETEITAASRFHIEGLQADGLPVPAPSAVAEYVEA